MATETNNGEIVIYKAPDGPELKISFQDETVWLTQAQIAGLFGAKQPAISKHLRNIFKSGELAKKAVYSILEYTAADGKTYKVGHYSLDAVLAVGYRVSSARATQFRIWATQKLKDYLLKGYLINEARLREAQDVKLKELQQAHNFIRKALELRRLSGYEKELLNIISDYTETWVILNRYDQGQLDLEKLNGKKPTFPSYAQTKDSIERFKRRLMEQNQASGLFGRETGNKLAAILGTIQQGFNGKDLYQSLEEKAANLFYLVIKDHPFVDGNKRIGSLLFLLFLIENNYLYDKKGERKFNDNALVALALLIAESKPADKEVMVNLIVNLINKK